MRLRPSFTPRQLTRAFSSKESLTADLYMSSSTIPEYGLLQQHSLYSPSENICLRQYIRQIRSFQPDIMSSKMVVVTPTASL
mmetsp:Transcript_76951/g.127578  ORF Transcript_76951/g.127578 Transcript_76951/m.127578 type:complete len:82 (-) Transcript_76951:884-1129(-)